MSLLLNMIFINYGVGSTLPNTSYMKALDIYVFVCVSFISAALLQIALSSFIKVSTSSFIISNTVPHVTASHVNSNNVYDTARKDKGSEEHSGQAERIPKLHVVSRIIFPVAFALFLLIYWIYYTQV